MTTYDVTTTPDFQAGRERGVTWAKEVCAGEADPRVEVTVETIQAALGSDRGDTAHGFLRGVRDVVMAFPRDIRPNVLIEVARSPFPAGPRPRQRLRDRFRGAMFGDDD